MIKILVEGGFVFIDICMYSISYFFFKFIILRGRKIYNEDKRVCKDIFGYKI